ncbi:hypothetical protein TREMEDRAFT_65632 [Tremella mesenterica DSM 1558]|uniref:uncharacterized protein n=1 Tax=Tremella mesenterica (strain ATCC 24925 / CBS 8224 / DSM 1558 / NBRC 9311 / NRRL Y-6157 / RJB 2259-6 / UBC 559-6) TaxID=578456 RepID=UPI00032D3327|nr:uncharacterized protein TREMEDRAFT_65632 [Tremella mesenterica DSM 1558]EIW66354.1 hypothetical protein TREMEDRAFT_65632 [Tremella mesenterica DSM 1558]
MQLTQSSFPPSPSPLPVDPPRRRPGAQFYLADLSEPSSIESTPRSHPVFSLHSSNVIRPEVILPPAGDLPPYNPQDSDASINSIISLPQRQHFNPSSPLIFPEEPGLPQQPISTMIPTQPQDQSDAAGPPKLLSPADIHAEGGIQITEQQPLTISYTLPNLPDTPGKLHHSTPSPLKPSPFEMDVKEFPFVYPSDSVSDGYMPGKRENLLDTLLEIHRVLYGGEQIKACMAERREGVKQLVERFFEGDVVYDHPLVKLTSRNAVVTHFTLCNLASTLYLPSVTPTGMKQHTKAVITIFGQQVTVVGSSVASRAWYVVSLILPKPRTISFDPEKAALTALSKEKGKGKGKGKETEKEKMKEKEVEEGKGQMEKETKRWYPDGGNEAWWRLYDISSEFKDLGALETFEGHHSALIQHVVTLRLLPALLKPIPAHPLPLQRDTINDHGSLGMFTEKVSYTHRIAAAVAQECEGLLRWQLPMSTLVEFNEMGRAVRLRDNVDIRDLVEAVVPLAKTFSTLSRRLTGLLTGTIGNCVLKFIPEPVLPTSISRTHTQTPTPMTPPAQTLRNTPYGPVLPPGWSNGIKA